jgi:hypothetical protein
VAEKAAVVDTETGPLTEVLLQRGERAVVSDGDGADRPGHRREVHSEETRPPSGGQSPEDQNGQVGDVGDEDKSSQRREDGGHAKDVTARRNRRVTSVSRRTRWRRLRR